ncbi:hypothetical protein MSAN_01200000 [Mycena sanguinolenta]|uniref:Uncharacterized protein n=1 Tax=Mycena sanguinolenta TaxID=230812 RepID=A0A8H6YF77_9AGAR|nr:hypothetical protein MSAN_01200000 [Mycena sanguinolenta]
MFAYPVPWIEVRFGFGSGAESVPNNARHMHPEFTVVRLTPLLSTVMPTCAGCNGNFSKSGLRRHLRLTTKDACARLFASAEAALSMSESESDNDHDVDQFGNLSDSGLPSGHTHFQGDYFGTDYTQEQLGYSEDEEMALGDEDDDRAASESEAAAESEDGYEPPRPDPPLQSSTADSNPLNTAPIPAPSRVIRKGIEDRFHHKPIIEKFPGNLAGTPISDNRDATSEERYCTTFRNDKANPYAPFRSKRDWEFAKWAKTRGPGSTAFTDLIQIEGVREALGLSYGTSAQLNAIIDNELPTGRPKFHRSEVVVDGQVFPLYSRDILECVRALFGDSDFAPYLFVAPERHYIDKDKTVRMYHNMHTGKWWWATQEAVEKEYPGATIVPIIISSDKTQLTVFGNKTAYPVYMTLGNIPKEIRRKPSRRGYILLAYLPTSRMKHITNKAARRRILANVFHACMSYILEPLQTAGVSGIRLTSGDGVVRRGHPIFATFVGDYPEQALVATVKTGDCPTCEVPHTELGDGESDYPLRNLDRVLDALDQLDNGSTAPDILHQLYHGVVKHLIAWLKDCCGEAEIDARCRRLPPNHNIRLFMKGISNLSRVTGKEHDQISRFLLGIIIDIRLPNNLSPYPMHTDETLSLLEDALDSFHANKAVFVDLGIRSEFNLPKLHACKHYVMYIKFYGTTDNYTTEYTERLHIDLTKEAYRSTNFKNEFPQMTLWLERKEKIFCHEKFIQWRLDGCPAPLVVETLHPGIIYERQLVMPKFPTVKSVKISRLVDAYGAKYFRKALVEFIVHHSNPTFSLAQVEAASQSIHLPFNVVAVFHRIKFTTPDPYAAGGTINSVVDAVHVQPAHQSHSQHIPGRFDTVLVNNGNGGLTGVEGYRVAQVRVVFSIPAASLHNLFPPTISPPKHLAYVEWFSPFSSEPEPHHLLYKLKPSYKNGERLCSIIPVANIRRSIQLLPKFGPVAPKEWTSSNVLEQCPVFFANSLGDRHLYATII